MTITLQRIDDRLWEIPRSGTMRVPGRIYASARQIEELRSDPCLQQIVNVAHLPGIVGYALAMPDIHWGYGFPIGGVAAMRLDDGVISPGAVGYDVNCGVRLLATRLTDQEIRPQLGGLAERLFRNIPSGVGAHGRLRLGAAELQEVLRHGAQWAVRRGLGRRDDPRRIESE